MDSSAAITSRTKSIPPTPASMFLTNFSWPGNIDEADLDIAQIEMRESQIDRNSPQLLFF